MFKNDRRLESTFYTAGPTTRPAADPPAGVVVVVAAAAATVAPKGKMWDGTRPKGGSFRRGKGRQSATSRAFLLSTG